MARINDAGDKVEVWEGSQAPDAIRARGRQGARPQARAGHASTSATWAAASAGARSATTPVEARADRASEVGRPVKLVWTREEDIAQGMFRPQSFQCLEAATDATGKVTGWKHCVVGDGGVAAAHGGMQDPLLRRAQPAHRAARRIARHPAQALARGRRTCSTSFAIESFVDQMAADAEHGPDRVPLPAHGDHPEGDASASRRWRRCATGRRTRPDGRALGVSITERSGSLGAGVVEISLDRADRQDQGPQGVGRGRRRHHRHARRRPRPTSRAPSSTGSRACCTSASRMKDGVVEQIELPRLQPDAHVRPAGGDARRSSSTWTRGRPGSARSAIRSSPARSPTRSTS